MGKLDGRVAIVTGGASGIGRAIVEELLKEGARVVFTGITEAGERKTVVTSQVFSGDTLTAEGEVIAVRVPPSWRNP